MISQTYNKPRLGLRFQAELSEGLSLLERADERVHAMMRTMLGVITCPPVEKEWIVFQAYHWVLDDQRESFRRQLQFLRRYGDFITLDEAVTALQSPAGIGGRYFCVTFDDGFENCFHNAVPVLKELNVPACFFIPTQYIGLKLDHNWDQIEPFYTRSWTRFKRLFGFLDWDQCRLMSAAGFTLGSHTHSHRRLTSLQVAEAESELSISRQIIEEKLGSPCRHFCCPWGKSNKDFDAAVHPALAQRAGYHSFLTTDDGPNFSGHNVYGIARSTITAEEGPLVLRYSLFRSCLRSVWERLIGPAAA